MSIKGVKFGKYVLLEHIASGGMAEIFKGAARTRDGSIRTVAIKRILPELSSDDEFVTLMIDEAKIMLALSHPNIVSLIEFGKVKDSYFIAFEYVDGLNIKDLLLSAKKIGVHIPYHLTAYIFHEVMSGLSYAHTRKDEQGRSLNIVHRDISPTNIMVSYGGQVKILDFGIAKAAGQGQRTQVGIIRGKSGYMSPEQAMAKKDLDGRTDIFSAGIIMYEMLTLTRLFRAEDPMKSIKMIRECNVPHPLTRNRNVPSVLCDIVMKALQKDLSARYQTAAEMRDDLEAALKSMGKWECAPTDLKEYLEIISEIDSKTAGEIVEALDTEPTRPEEKSLIEGQDEVGQMFDDMEEREFEGSLDELYSEDSITLLANKKFENELDLEEDSEFPSKKRKVETGKWKFATIFSVLAILVAFLLIFSGLLGGHRARVVKIVTEPSGALVFIDNSSVAVGRTPFEVKVDKEKRNIHIKLAKEGYEPVVRDIHLTQSGFQSLYFSLRKVQVISKILAVYSMPSGAEVFIDGVKQRDRTPLVLENIKAGKIKVRIVKEGYEPVERDVEFEGGQKFKKLDLVLIPSASKKISQTTSKRVYRSRIKRKNSGRKVRVGVNGYLSLNSIPFSTVTVLKGKRVLFTAQTPILKRPMPPGVYSAVLKTLDGQVKRVSFEIKRGKVSRLKTVYFDTVQDDFVE